MESYNKLVETVTALQVDAEKFFDKGNAAAGTRVRKALQEIKKQASDMRKEVSEKKSEK